ncbi:hypothetical protein ATL39_0052 [Sinobaca qinghaiensis]|uniref:Uncharacterized protein n=1 Tax=Sinobaca qinghaiensis TaxID=342944 RepID=A0A419VTV8_9BACL|nr:hypothetical protein [Sinobaca qinghaiensis]RKD84119.1 hypothetical protein ATL39_0052 [Sinobaca qinghaiensis]
MDRANSRVTRVNKRKRRRSKSQKHPREQGSKNNVYLHWFLLSFFTSLGSSLGIAISSKLTDLDGMKIVQALFGFFYYKNLEVKVVY